MVNAIKEEFQKLSSKTRADHSSRFFKTGKGEYSYKDKFIGVRTPDIYKIANKYKKDITISDILYFLQSEIHNYRFLALDFLKYRYNKGNRTEKKEIVKLYLDNIRYVNNWDLVDISAPHILGDYLLDKDRKILYELVKKDYLWSNRIAIISTFAFIRNNEYDDTLRIAKLLLNHEHDLIHKAVGWMLREIWKRDSKTAEEFIKNNYEKMPRTTLRYAIEKMEEKKRKTFLKGEFNYFPLIVV